MTEEQKKKWMRRAALFGFVLGIVCHALPPHYRAPCELLSKICTGG